MPPFIAVLPLHNTTLKGEVGPYGTAEEIHDLDCWPEPNDHNPSNDWTKVGQTEPKPLCHGPGQPSVAGEILEKTEN